MPGGGSPRQGIIWLPQDYRLGAWLEEDTTFTPAADAATQDGELDVNRRR